MGVSKREQFIEEAIASRATDCITWPFAARKSSGYGAHSYRQDGKKINADVHRFVCELAHGAPAPGMEAAHRCGNRLCINPAHLYWADHLTNMADAKRHGTLRGGGRHRQRIFPADIRAICSSKASLMALAQKYGTGPSHIARLRRVHGAA